MSGYQGQITGQWKRLPLLGFLARVAIRSEIYEALDVNPAVSVKSQGSVPGMLGQQGSAMHCAELLL